jgi:putative glutamine transport system substrate-binding protein
VVIAGAILAVAVYLISLGNERAEVEAAVGKVAKRGVINIGLRGDLGQLSSYDEQTKTFSGLEKDIADEIADRLFPDGIILNYVAVNSKTKDSLLQTGALDISLGASVRAAVSGIKYTEPFFSDGAAFLVVQGNMTSEKGLSGGTIAVVQGSIPATKVKKDDELTRIEAYIKAREIDADVRTFASYPEAVEALRAGHVRGVCANEVFLRLYGRSGMLILPERFMPVGFSVQVNAGLGVFYDAVEGVIADMKRDGTLELLIKKWELTDYAFLEE